MKANGLRCGGVAVELLLIRPATAYLLRLRPRIGLPLLCLAETSLHLLSRLLTDRHCKNKKLRACYLSSEAAPGDVELPRHVPHRNHVSDPARLSYLSAL